MLANKQLQTCLVIMPLIQLKVPSVSESQTWGFCHYQLTIVTLIGGEETSNQDILEKLLHQLFPFSFLIFFLRQIMQISS